ncbi:MAG: TIGR02221 family CRISPR-associated protein, partial [Roseiflexaceae bacterium]|nr:TIGR02221 family CRISPR-associated protein [Roseiflexaceae bacterium]
MAVAAAHFFTPDQLLVVETDKAAAINHASLLAELNGFRQPITILIPDGRSEAEIWTIFNRIADHVHDGDQIIFDITNAFRHLPVLALLVASYLRVVRHVTLTHMIYGAFDLSESGCTPVFDLSPFLVILEWTTATDAFVSYGRADALTDLVEASPTYRPLANTLRQLTAALQTSRPAQVMELAQQLGVQLAQQKQIVNDTSDQPFELLLDSIAHEYQPLALSNPRLTARAQAFVQQQLAAINWYIEKGLYVQAITSAREWLISHILEELNHDLFNRASRHQAEQLLNSERSTIAEADIAQLIQIRTLWKDTIRKRNSVAHVGMQPNAPTAATVERDVRDICHRLQVLL